MRAWIFRMFEEDIESLVTRRILLYHGKLISDGFIPDIPRSSLVDMPAQDRPSQLYDSLRLHSDAHKCALHEIVL